MTTKKQNSSTQKRLRIVDKIKRLFLVAVILLIIASMVLVDISHLFL